MLNKLKKKLLLPLEIILFRWLLRQNFITWGGDQLSANCGLITWTSFDHLLNFIGQSQRIMLDAAFLRFLFYYISL